MPAKNAPIIGKAAINFARCERGPPSAHAARRQGSKYFLQSHADAHPPINERMNNKAVMPARGRFRPPFLTRHYSEAPALQIHARRDPQGQDQQNTDREVIGYGHGPAHDGPHKYIPANCDLYSPASTHGGRYFRPLLRSAGVMPVGTLAERLRIRPGARESRQTRLFARLFLLNPHVVARAYPPWTGDYRTLSAIALTKANELARSAGEAAGGWKKGRRTIACLMIENRFMGLSRFSEAI